MTLSEVQFVGTDELRSHWAKLADEVASGKKLVVTWHGHPTAVIISPTEWDRLSELDRNGQNGGAKS